jgi:DHA2 family multidrug resistance protein
VVNTWLGDNTRIHVARIGESLGEAGSVAPDFMMGLAARIGEITPDHAQAVLMAQGELAKVVGRYAMTLAFNDVFRLMSWIFLAALVMVPFCRPAPQTSAPPPDAH